MATSPLADSARRLGAVSFTCADGIEVARDFGDPPSEYRALVERAGVVDLAFRRRIRVLGRDRLEFLHAMLSNDLKRLRPGQGCHALLLTVQGRVVADCIVVVEEGCILLDTVAGRSDSLTGTLGKYVVADDVTFEPIGAKDHAIGVLGPLAAAVAEQVAGGPPPEGEPYASRHGELGGVPFSVVALPEPRPGGFMFVIEEKGALSLWERLVRAARASVGGLPAGFLAFESLRLESGQPWCGLDMGEDTIALEAGMERAISFTKGCYLGQEVIERVSSQGRLNRRLEGLRLTAAAGPKRGDKLYHEGKEVGFLTSVAHSFKLDSTLALGYVRRELARAGTALALEGGKGLATVVPLPI